MAYSVITAILISKGNDNAPVSIGTLKRVLQELLMSLPSNPIALDSGSSVPT